MINKLPGWFILEWEEDKEPPYASTKKRTIALEDLYRFQMITSPRLSPDGNHVIYAQMRVDQKTEKKYSNLWTVAVDGSPARQFTFGDQADTQPRWSPDGTQIAFLSNRATKKNPPRSI